LSRRPFGKELAQGDAFFQVALSESGQYFAASTTRYLYIFNRSSPVPLWRYDYGSWENTVRLGISADGQYIVAARWGGSVSLFHLTEVGIPTIPGFAGLPLIVALGVVVGLGVSFSQNYDKPFEYIQVKSK
jgi:hypothetical protein